MKHQINPFPLIFLVPLATGLFLTGCERPEVPLPVNSTVPAKSSTTASSEPMAAERLVPAQAAADYTAWSTCNMEQIDGQPFSGKPLSVKAGRDFVVTGFVLIEEGRTVPTDVKLRVLASGNPSAWEADVKGRVNRPDVPQYFKLGEWAAGAGIEQLVSSAALAPGTYQLVFTFSNGGRQLICDNGRQVSIDP